MKKNEEKFMKDLLGIARHCLEIRRSDNRSMNKETEDKIKSGEYILTNLN